jgi:hypothetical protein
MTKQKKKKKKEVPPPYDLNFIQCATDLWTLVRIPGARRSSENKFIEIVTNYLVEKHNELTRVSWDEERKLNSAVQSASKLETSMRFLVSRHLQPLKLKTLRPEGRQIPFLDWNDLNRLNARSGSRDLTKSNRATWLQPLGQNLSSPDDFLKQLRMWRSAWEAVLNQNLTRSKKKQSELARRALATRMIELWDRTAPLELRTSGAQGWRACHSLLLRFDECMPVNAVAYKPDWPKQASRNSRDFAPATKDGFLKSIEPHSAASTGKKREGMTGAKV